MRHRQRIIPIASNPVPVHKPAGSAFFENLWTVTDLAAHLQVSPKTVYDWVHHRVIPFTKIRGRLLRFRPSEIERWLSQEGGQHGNKQDPQK
jgi:excisionase family DNA binding protein